MTTLIKRNLSGGEIAPELYAHVDLNKYASSVRLLRNFIVARTGGAQNRVGTQFTGEIFNSTKTIRLIPFVISISESYVIELGDLYIRIIFNGKYLTNSQVSADGPFSITAITKANPAVVTAASHGYSNGQQAIISGAVGMAEVNGRTFIVQNVTTNTFSLQYLGGAAVDSTAFSTYISGATVDGIFKIVSPFAVADLPLVKYSQNFNSMCFTNEGYQPVELTLSSSASPNFFLSNSTTVVPDSKSVLTPVNVSVTGSPGTAWYYSVAPVGPDGEEGFPTALVGTGTTPASGTPVTVTWDEARTPSPVFAYNVYRFLSNGIGGLIAANVPAGSGIIDAGSPASNSLNYATSRQPILKFPVASGVNPGCSTYFQQRKFFGAGETIWASWVGHYTDFFLSNTPSNDSMPIIFSISGSKVNDIQHFIGLTTFFLLTSNAELVAGGSSGGPITSTDINVQQASAHGSYYIQPIAISNRILFVQARGSIIRDLGYEYTQDNYQGNDLTIFATHLFDGYTVADWSYQQTPNSIVWVVRSDGVLLSLTYIREQQILAWSRHDFQGGFVENVAVIPEATGDTPYFTVRRTINGRTVRYIERMLPAVFTDVRNCTYMDANLSFDGRNTDSATTVTLSGGTTWDYTETLTLTTTGSGRTGVVVGDEVQLFDATGAVIRFTVTAISSATVCTGRPNRTVPADLQGVATATWARAVQTVSGLYHLIGQTVSVFADGYVVASPNNPTVSTVCTVNSQGQVTLDQPYAVIHVGLPFVSDIETLDLDLAQEETLADKKKIISRVTVYVNNSRGMWIGNNPKDAAGVTTLTGLDELKIRNEEGYDSPVALHQDQVDVNIQPAANKNGRVFIRQVDPVPLTVCAIAPAGMLPLGGR